MNVTGTFCTRTLIDMRSTSLIWLIATFEGAGGFGALFPFFHVRLRMILDGTDLTELRLISLLFKC
jgi:hypothetical protein